MNARNNERLLWVCIARQKAYKEVSYFVNDSYMTVLGNPQDPVYVPIVLQGSGNSTPSYTRHQMADGFASSSRFICLDPHKKEQVTRCGPSLHSLHLKYKWSTFAKYTLIIPFFLEVKTKYTSNVLFFWEST